MDREYVDNIAASQVAEVSALMDSALRTSGFASAAITDITRLHGGVSKENWAMQLVADGYYRDLVLRTEPSSWRFDSTDKIELSTEAALLRLVRAAGVPTPEIFCELPAGHDNRSGYAMQRIDGETLGAKILRDPQLAFARRKLARQCGQILARIHSIALDSLPALPCYTLQTALSALRSRLDATGHKRPVLELAFCWLELHMPANDALALVHGDFRNGNFIVGTDGIRAVLDWETAHIGPPAEDLGWLCVPSWRFQCPDLPVGGFGERADLLDGYHAAGGSNTSLADLKFWQAFGSLRWAINCAEQGMKFEQGVRTIETAMLARRASEAEYDLLQLMQE